MAKTQHNPTTEYLKTLTQAGVDDIVVLRRETAERVFTEKRFQLVERIAEGDVSSVRDLARQTERDVSIVSRDLEVLVEADVIKLVEDGRAKRPVLAHDNIVVEPITFSGSTAASEELAVKG